MSSKQNPANLTAGVLNVTRGTELASAAEVAKSGARRSKSLLGRQGLAPGRRIWIVPCEAVHTFFMQFAIDPTTLSKTAHQESREWCTSLANDQLVFLHIPYLNCPPGSFISHNLVRVIY